MDLRLRAFQRDRVPVPPDSLILNEIRDWVRSAPRVALEIGCGVGWHPILWAEANPDSRLVAIERTKQKFAVFAGKLAHHQIKQRALNLRAVHGDGIAWMVHAFADQSVDTIFLMYPNPYPGDDNQRWLRMPAFEECLRILKPDGKIILATDQEFYLTESRALAQSHWALAIVESTIESGLPGADGLIAPRTHFEKKYLASGRVCAELVLSRTSPKRTP